MSKLMIAAICLVSGLAIAQDDEEKAEGPIEEMQIRLTTMEEINVTSEKTIVESTEDLDSEIESILSAAEELEDES